MKRFICLLPILACMVSSALHAQNMSFRGSVLNSTLNIGGVIKLDLTVQADGTITGLISNDGYPSGPVLCGEGAITGKKTGNVIQFSYTSDDHDTGCSVSQGSVGVFSAVLNEYTSALTGTFNITPVGGKTERGYLQATGNVGCSPEYLQRLRLDYQKKLGTPQEDYAALYLCLAEKSCNEFSANGKQGWAGSFVSHLFTYMATNNAGSTGLDAPCSTLDLPLTSKEVDKTINKVSCFVTAGAYHFKNELWKGFFTYCADTKSKDQAKWTADHKAFISDAVTKCYDNLAARYSNDLSLKKVYQGSKYVTIAGATLLRNTAQVLCTYGSYLNQRTENSLPDPLSKKDLFSEQLDSVGTLKLTAGTTFFLSVGSATQLSTVARDAKGSTYDYTNASTGTKYFLNVEPSIAVISADGKLTILKTPAPLVTITPVIYVIAVHGNEYGIGQFAITDKDRDGDYIVDSHDLYPTVATQPSYDGDRDGLTDMFELLLGTNPSKTDTDGDGFSDSFEVYTGNDPLDAKKTPASIVILAAKSPATYQTIGVYPNPFKDVFKVIASELSSLDVQVQIFDVTGKLVLEERSKRPSATEPISVNAERLSPGVYMLKLSNDKGEMHTQKLLKSE